MFNKNSIFFTLGISFFISLFLILFSYFLIMEKDLHQYDKTLKKRYFTVVQLIQQEYQRVGFTEALEDVINDMGFDIVDSDKIGETLRQNDIELLFKRKMDFLYIYILKGNSGNFISIQAPFDEYLLIDRKVPKQEFKTLSFLIFLSVLGVFIFLSYRIYKKLYPLNELKEKIDSMANDEISYETIDIRKKDEVSLLAKVFQEKANNLKKIKDARNIFIRNIMHELKTPITKGRFLAELPQNEENKEKLKYVFFQLESLINELASIEEVITKGSKIVKKEYLFTDILENAMDKLMIEEENCSFEEKELKLHVNFKLFTIAVKNLLDNAVKFSPEKKVFVKVEDGAILFENRGEKLKYPLDRYFEPFFNSESNNGESFGLGLYIVNSILEAHGCGLEYEFKDNKNIFKIVL